MPQSKKKAVKMTTDEAIRKLFPKRVIEKAKRVAAGPEARARSNVEKDASGT